MTNELYNYWIKSNDDNSPFDASQKNSLKVFLQIFDVDKIKEAIDIANAKEIKNSNERFRYLCGILNNWKKEQVPGNAEVMEVMRYWNKKRPHEWKKADEGVVKYLVDKFGVDKIKLYIDLTIKEEKGWTDFSDVKTNLEKGKYE